MALTIYLLEMAVVTADVPKKSVSIGASTSGISRIARRSHAKTQLQQKFQANPLCPYTGGGGNVTSGPPKDPEFGNWYESDNIVDNLRTFIPRVALIDSPPDGISPDGEQSVI